MCETIKGLDHGETFGIHGEWITSRTWGANPRIMFRGEKTTNTSGCGYCKLSACLASALRFLDDSVDLGHGAGESTVIAGLARIGYRLTPISSGKMHDSYTIERVVQVTVAPARTDDGGGPFPDERAVG
jgi:hypothetical protein